MNLAEKLRHLRWLEGHLQGKGRPLSKTEVVRGMRAELADSISHAYLCQLESGAREQMSPRTRTLLANFFKVHPGYLVGDPNDYYTCIVTDIGAPSDIRSWLSAHAEETRDDPLVYHVLLRLARQAEPRRYFAVLNMLLDLPAESIDRLLGDTAAPSGGAP